MRIAHLIAYRLTHHTTIGVSPAELLFGRKIRTKLFEFREDRVASEVQDRDGETKAKAKLYADKKRHTEYSNLVPGDRVLLKQEKKNKLSTPFAPEPYEVVSRNGNSIIIKSPESVQLKRNTAHVKTCEESPQLPSRTVSLPVREDVQAESPTYRRILRRMVERKGMLCQLTSLLLLLNYVTSSQVYTSCAAKKFVLVFPSSF